MSTRMRSAPSSASRSAWLRPKPRAAPVIRMRLPATRAVVIRPYGSFHIRPRMVTDWGMSSTVTNPVGARHTQSIAFTARPAVEIQPASVESSSG